MRRLSPAAALLAVLLWPALAASAGLERFLERGCSSTLYGSEDFHPEFSGDFRLEKNATALDRERALTGLRQGRQMLSAMRLLSLDVTERRDNGGIVEVSFRYRCLVQLGSGLPVLLEGATAAHLVPGGPNGFQWYRVNSINRFGR